MATVKDTDKAFCDTVYQELAGMKKKMIDLKDLTGREGSRQADLFNRHLSELIDEIDWKIQILSHSCPYDWAGSRDYENPVQVPSAGKNARGESSPGDVGG